MGVAERRLREKEELRSKIVEAAAQLFIEEGFDQVSMRKIADRIEYSPSTIYLYFKDKNELCQHICNETFSGLLEALEELQAQPMSLEEKLRRSFRTYIDFGLSHRQQYTFSLLLPEPAPAQVAPEAKHSIMEAGLKAFDNLRQGIREGMEAGVIRQADLETTAQVVWTQLHGVTSLLITSKSFPFIDHETLIEAAVDHVMRGLKR